MTSNDERTPTPGRPRIYQQPRYRLTLELAADLVRQIDDMARPASMTRTAWIEAAIREKLARSE